jgi:hypothetical protein
MLGATASGASVTISVGITVDHGTHPPVAMTPEWYECRFDARVVAGGIEVLTPCDGFRGYVFPNGARAIGPEDVSPVVRVEVDPLTPRGI